MVADGVRGEGGTLNNSKLLLGGVFMYRALCFTICGCRFGLFWSYRGIPLIYTSGHFYYGSGILNTLDIILGKKCFISIIFTKQCRFIDISGLSIIVLIVIYFIYNIFIEYL